MAAEAEAAVNALKKLEANKTCVNCGAYNRFGHQNVCEKVRTFVCGTCKSAHQSFSMRVKSVSMSNWTMDEVDALRESNGGGNVVAARVWLGRWDEAQLRKPTKDDPLEYYKHFIDRVYNAQEFYEAKGERGATAAASSRTGTISGHQSTAVPDLLDLDPPAQAEASTAATLDTCSSLETEEWGSFEAAVLPSSCSDEEFGESAFVPTLTSGSDEFAGFSTAPGPASALAHTEVFGAFASAAPAPTSMSFDPFAGSNVAVPFNAPVSAGVTSLDPGVFVPTSQGQQSVAAAAAPVSVLKDFSVFDGLAAPLPTSGTFQRDGRDRRRAEWERHDCGQPQHQMRVGLDKPQRMDTLQPPGSHPPQQQQQQLMAGCGNAGMNPISRYFSSIVPGAFGGNSSRDLKSSSRDPFAGLGL